MSTSFDLKIDLGVLKPEHIAAALKSAFDAAGAAYSSEMKNYPAQSEVAPGTKYERTGTLGNTATYKTETNLVQLIGRYYGAFVLGGTRYWAGWPGKKEAILSRCETAFREAFNRAMHK